MYCLHCGNKLRADDDFCPACGRQVERDGAQRGKKKKRGKRKPSPARWILPLLIALLVVAAGAISAKKLTASRRGAAGAGSPAGVYGAVELPYSP